jgi:ABC-2 type transport system permease protein
MNQVTLQIFLYELRRGLRRRGYLFSAFGIPALVLLGLLIAPRLAGVAAQDAAESISRAQERAAQSGDALGYVDLSRLLDGITSSNPRLTRYPDEESARAALDAREIAGYYRIEPDYLETGAITTVIPTLRLDTIDSAPIRRLMLFALTQGLDPDLAARLTRTPNFTNINISLLGAEESGGLDEGGTFLIVYVFALALLIGVFFTNGYLLQTVIEEKETRLIEILISSVRPSDLLTGKILAMGLLGLLQMVLWVGGIILAIQIAGGGAGQLEFLASIANIRLPAELVPLLAIYFVLAYLLFAALYGVVGALSNSMREGPQYAVIFTIPAVLPLYFINLFATAPDGTIPTVMSLFPLTAPIAMVQRLAISVVPPEQIILSIVLLTAACIGALWLAGRLFRMQTLLAGQTIKLKELPKLLSG